MSSLLHHNVKLDPPLAIFNMDNPPASFQEKKEPPSQNVDKSPEDNNFYWEEAGNYSCKTCDYTSRQRDRMIRHYKNVHLKEKPFVCTQCNTSFGRKDKLKRHMDTVHSDAKPFKCDFCSTSFNRRDKLKQHVSSIHSALVLQQQQQEQSNPFEPETILKTDQSPVKRQEDPLGGPPHSSPPGSSEPEVPNPRNNFQQYRYEDSPYHNPFTAAYLSMSNSQSS